MSMAKRNTIQRQLVLEAVAALTCHPSAEQVYHRVSASYPDIGLATVYRNLNALSTTGMVRKIGVPGAADRFDATLLPHYHIKCASCGAFKDVDVNCVSIIDHKIADATGFYVEPHDIVFQGVCPSCRHVDKWEKEQN